MLLTVLISSNRLLLFARAFYLTASGNELARCIKSRRDYYQRKSCPGQREQVVPLGESSRFSPNLPSINRNRFFHELQFNLQFHPFVMLSRKGKILFVDKC